MMVTGWIKIKLASPVRTYYFLTLVFETGHIKLVFLANQHRQHTTEMCARLRLEEKYI